MEGHGGNFAAEALRQHGVDTVFTLSGGHLFPLYDGCVKRGHPPRRRPPRADGDLRRRGLGQAHPPARGGRAHRRPGRHQRHLAPSPRAQFNGSPAGRARRPGPAGPLGGGLAPGVRPRPGRGPGHQAGGDRRRHRRHRRRGRRAWPRPPRPHRGPCSSTSRSTWCFAAGRGRPCPAPRRRRARRRARPRGRGGRGQLAGRGRPAGDRCRRRRLLGRRRGSARGGGRGTSRARRRERPGPGQHPRRPRAGLHPDPGPLSRSADLVRGRRARRSTSGSASAASATPRSSTSSTRRQVAAHAELAASAAGDLRPSSAALADYRRRARRTHERGSPARGRRDAARRRDGASRARPTTPTHQARPDLRRGRRAPRPRRRRRQRRRRLRLLRRQVRRHLRARLLARPRPLRLPRHRPGLRPRRPPRPPRQAGRRADGRRRRRLLLMDFDTLVRHDLPVVDRRRQQRHLGPREAPDAGDLRLRRRRRAHPGTRYDEVVDRPRRRRRAGRATRPTSAPPSTGPSPPACPYLVNVLTDPAGRVPARARSCQAARRVPGGARRAGLRLLEEALAVDDHPRDAPGGDETVVVADRDP